MKGKSSYRLLAEFPPLHKRFWGRHVWARGYFCRSSGNVTDDVIRAYMAQRSAKTRQACRALTAYVCSRYAAAWRLAAKLTRFSHDLLQHTVIEGEFAYETL
jgi:hypothetical protein